MSSNERRRRSKPFQDPVRGVSGAESQIQVSRGGSCGSGPHGLLRVPPPGDQQRPGAPADRNGGPAAHVAAVRTSRGRRWPGP